MSCLLIFTSIYPLTRLIGLAVEMYRMKRLLNFLETRTLLMNTLITIFVLLEDFFISFSRVVIVQDFETVTFFVLLVYKPTFSAFFLLN